MSKFSRLTFGTIKRVIPRNGPFDAETWNDTIEEITNDLASLQSEWNNKIVPFGSILPDGVSDANEDAFKYGLDGTACYVDNDAATSSLFYGKTIKDALEDIYLYNYTLESTLTNLFNSKNYGLTTAQKTAIGDHIFNSSLTSSSSSIDYKSEAARLNNIQLAKDLYGASYTLDNDGNANLANSVQAMVGALLTLHNGTWASDITLNHDSFSVVKDCVTSSGNIFYTSSFVDSGLEITLDLLSNQRIGMSLAGTAYAHLGATTAEAQITLDGVPICSTGCHIAGITQRQNISMSSITLSGIAAGSHTLKVQCKKNSGGDNDWTLMDGVMFSAFSLL